MRIISILAEHIGNRKKESFHLLLLIVMVRFIALAFSKAGDGFELVNDVWFSRWI